jgi:hypothetical protein
MMTHIPYRFELLLIGSSFTATSILITLCQSVLNMVLWRLLVEYTL